jgi:ribonuclease BN (tRNA processing enzyme)
VWIENNRGALLLDVGEGILRDLRSNSLDLGSLKAIIITHGHFDHIGGLHSLLGYLRMIGREADLPIHIPKGSPEVPGIVHTFLSVYRATTPYTISVLELEPHESFEVSSMSIEAYPVVHCGGIAGQKVLDQIPALGYRISYSGETVAVTGDTGMCASLAELVRDSDLALIEATFGDARGVSREELERVHLSEKDARELGSLAKRFILVHKGGNT